MASALDTYWDGYDGTIYLQDKLREKAEAGEALSVAERIWIDLDSTDEKQRRADIQEAWENVVREHKDYDKFPPTKNPRYEYALRTDADDRADAEAEARSRSEAEARFRAEVHAIKMYNKDGESSGHKDKVRDMFAKTGSKGLSRAEIEWADLDAYARKRPKMPTSIATVEAWDRVLRSKRDTSGWWQTKGGKGCIKKRRSTHKKKKKKPSKKYRSRKRKHTKRR
jgi:hypothetical protein